MKNNKKINICFFSGDINRSGGTERASISIANELCKNYKYNISFLSLENKTNDSFYTINKKISKEKMYENLGRSIFHIFGIIHKLKKYVKKNNVDILVDVDGILDIYSLPVKGITNTRVISWEHFNYYQNPIVPYRKYSRKMAARWADAIVTLTKEDQGYYQKNLQIKNRIEAIYNPIVIKNNEIKYDYKSNLIISVGRLSEEKGYDRLVEVAHCLKEKNDNWKWIILGDGEEYQSLKRMILDYKLDDYVILEGKVENVEEYYNKSSIFVMTSYYEGMPMSLLEAKSHKLPLISFDIKTGPKECIDDKINGYVCDDGDIFEMAERINELLTNEDKRIDFSNHAYDGIEEFQIDKIIDKWNKLIEDIMR